MFSVSTQVRYALRALLYIAEHSDESPVPLTRIAENEDISKKYLENIFTLLKRGGLVVSIRGPVGGYSLAVAPENLRLYDIVFAVDGRPRVVDCVDDPEACARRATCESWSVWDDFQGEMDNFLKSRTLESILADEKNEVKT
ncbi:MAG: RrF2 family transcriptional regulator [Spirochaetia bacterium]